MRCNNCSIYFHESQGAQEIILKHPKTEGMGFVISTNFCPNCYQLIVFMREGNTEYDQSGLHVIPIEDSLKILYPVGVKHHFPEQVPTHFADDFNEAKTVLELSPKASAALSRRLLQKFLRHILGAHDRQDNLYKEIDDFIVQKNPPEHLRRSIDAIRHVGNWAAHPLKERASGIIVDVSYDEASWLLEIIEELFEVYFVRPIIDEEKRKMVNEKLSKLGKPPLQGGSDS